MARVPTYPSDTSDEEWAILESLIPSPKGGGRPAKYPRRDIVDAIFYIKRGGNSWRMLPADFPYWKTVYDYFAQWRDDGTYERILDALRAQVREAVGRNAVPSAGALDSRSVKTSQKGGSEVTTVAKRSRGANTTS